MDRMRSAGFEVLLHTASPNQAENNRSLVRQAIEYMSQFDVCNWIDHGLSDGVRNSGIKSLGWNDQSPFYILDLFRDHGYRYAWSYSDVPI